jgi:hypothetical protein
MVVLSYNVTMKKVVTNGNTTTTTEIKPTTDDKNVANTSSNSKIPQGINTLKDLLDNLGLLAFEDSINIPTASSSTYGVVKTSTVYNDTSLTDFVPTSATLAAMNNTCVHLSGNESIAGIKTFEDGIIISGFRFRPERQPDGSIILNLEEVSS